MGGMITESAVRGENLAERSLVEAFLPGYTVANMLHGA